MKSECLTAPQPKLVAGHREPKKFVYDRGRIVQTKTHWDEQGKKKRAGTHRRAAS